jgi:multidrug efflux pump subunit AcrB
MSYILLMAKKATDREIDCRVNSVYNLLINGHSKTQVVQYCAENYNIKLRMAEEYISRARKLQQLDAELERPQWLLSALSRLQNYEAQSAKRGNHQAALRAVELQARLLRFELS